MMEIIILVVLLVLVVALFLLSYFKKKKFNTELGSMRQDLKPGDKVMTDTGVVGEVVEGYTEDEYKYFVLKTGRGEHTGYFTVHANAIYYVFDKDQKPEEKKVVVVKPQQKAEVKAEPAKEEKAEEVKTEAKVETKAQPKKSTKKAEK
mgnify:CR=1 FL=1